MAPAWVRDPHDRQVPANEEDLADFETNVGATSRTFAPADSNQTGASPDGRAPAGSAAPSVSGPGCWPLLSSPNGEASASGAGGSASQEGQQVGVELILVGVREAVRRARVVDFLGVLDEPG